MIIEDFFWINIPTDWYKTKSPIRISKGAEEGYGYGHPHQTGEIFEVKPRFRLGVRTESESDREILVAGK